MFEKSKIVWELTQMEQVADVPKDQCQLIINMINQFSLMRDAIRHTKAAKDPMFGAAHIVLAITEAFCKLSESGVPPEQIRRLLEVAIYRVQAIEGRNRALAFMLLPNFLGLLAEIELAAELESDASPNTGAENIISDLPDTVAAELPDIKISTPVLVKEFSGRTIMYYENPTTIGQSIGAPSIFDYPKLAVITKNSSLECIMKVEASVLGTTALCCTEATGMHSNLGPISDMELDQFVTRVEELISAR